VLLVSIASAQLVCQLRGGVSRGSDRHERTAQTCLERARALIPLLAAAAPRTEAQRGLPEDVLAAMHEAGMFRLLLPCR
jgi:hypothetical protein